MGSRRIPNGLPGVDVIGKTFVSLDGETLSLKKNKTKEMTKEKRNE